MSKIWITGIAGFLGSHLAEALIERGDTVAGNDSLICGDFTNVPLGVKRFVQLECQSNPTAMWHKSLADELKEFKPDVVIHAAATASEGFSVVSPHFITKNIAEASVATFSAAIAAGAKRIVHFSSMARYGHGKPPFRETDATNPVDPYGYAKVYSEGVLKSLCKAHDVKWAICTPHNCIGSRQQITPYRNVCTIFLNCLMLGRPVYIYGDGEQKRCFSPVKDCLHSLVKMVDGAADGHVINIGPDGGEITINQLLELCEVVTGKKAERIYVPKRPLTDDVKEAYCSSDKARSLLNFRPQQSLRDCLIDMVSALNPKPFDYNFPIEINNEICPRTWKEKLI